MIRSSFLRRAVPGLARAATAALLVALGASAPMAAQGVSPAPFMYGLGAQGFGYYAVPGVAAAPAAAVSPRPAATASTPTRAAAPAANRSVGPGARNWATGNRVPSHRPWLRSRS